MSTLLDLPSEFFEFLRRPRPQTLLLRGPPGTGKTTLALSLLQQFPGRRLFLSSRVIPTELARDFPWAVSDGATRILGVADSDPTLRATRRALSSAGEIVAEGVDSSPLRSLWLPTSVQRAWSELPQGEPSMIVIDSWDALVEKYLGSPPPADGGAPDRAEVERLLLDQFSHEPVVLVLVLERAETSHLDYLVSAVAELAWAGGDGYPERWLYLRKLRGVRVDTPAYPFTLDGGRFRCIPPMPFVGPLRLKPPDPDPAPVPGFLWPGSTEFARAFGSLPWSRLTLFEEDPSVSTLAARMLFSPIVSWVLQQGGPVLHILPPTALPEEVWSTYGELVGRERFERQIRIQPAAVSHATPEFLRNVILPPPRPDRDPGSPATPEALRFLRERSAPDHPGFATVRVSGLRALGVVSGVEYRPETLPGIAIEYASGLAGHILFMGPADDPLLVALRPMAALRIRLVERHGRVFVRGEQPQTPSYLLCEGDDARAFQLLRVV